MDCVYNYYFTQKTNRSRGNLGLEYTPHHGDDEVFLLSTDSLDDMVGVSEEEMMTMRMMIKYWTNFAKTGNPNGQNISEALPEWLPVRGDEMNYLELKAQPEMGKSVNKERMYFLDQMIWQQKENQLDYKTSGAEILLHNCFHLFVIISFGFIL